MNKDRKSLINISKKTFFSVIALLLALMAVSIALTYVIPAGEFGTLPGGGTDYSVYTPLEGKGGIPILQGILAPVLVFASSDGLTLIMLSLFLIIISAAFQVMNDVGGIRSLIGYVSGKFRNRRTLLLVSLSFVFYCFGAFLGLFEEMLTMLPIIASLCVLLGYDSYTGFLCSIISCGFGFASAITNPFTVLLASEIIGVSPMTHIYYRLVIFAVMFLLLQCFIFTYTGRISKDPSSSLTLSHDEAIRLSAADDEAYEEKKDARIRRIYSIFLAAALLLIVVSSLSEALRGYSVVILIAYFLIGGTAAGAIASGDFRSVMKSFLKGVTGALPTIAFIAMAASVKFILDKASILPTIVYRIDTAAEGRSPVQIALIIYLIVLALEFFISSSTAKAIIVMGLLSAVNVGLSKSMMVLLYTFADGYTNVIFPTSPVLLIALSMIEMNYFTWVKKSLPLFAVNTALVIGFIVLGVTTGY